MICVSRCCIPALLNQSYVSTISITIPSTYAIRYFRTGGREKNNANILGIYVYLYILPIIYCITHHIIFYWYLHVLFVRITAKIHRMRAYRVGIYSYTIHILMWSIKNKYCAYIFIRMFIAIISVGKHFNIST